MLTRLLAVFLMPTITMCAQLLFKSALDDRPFELAFRPLVSLFTHPHLLLGVALQGSGFVVWIYLISKLKLAEAFGIVGGAFYILVAIVGYFVLDERLSVLQMAGIATISIGVIALSVG